MTEKDLINACAAVLGGEVVAAMKSARVSLPQILNVAALKAFQDDRRGLDVDFLRIALFMLESPGYFTFEN